MAKSPTVRNLLRSFSSKNMETEFGQGVHIAKETPNTDDASDKSKDKEKADEITLF